MLGSSCASGFRTPGCRQHTLQSPLLHIQLQDEVSGPYDKAIGHVAVPLPPSVAMSMSSKQKSWREDILYFNLVIDFLPHCKGETAKHVEGVLVRASLRNSGDMLTVVEFLSPLPWCKLHSPPQVYGLYPSSWHLVPLLDSPVNKPGNARRVSTIVLLSKVKGKQ